MRILVLPGDGIGPEIVAAAITVLTAANDKVDAGLEFELDEVGFASLHNPARFDVIVATNLYGDILSDLASELSGGLGLAGSIMASDTHCCAQAQHGSAPDIQGKDLANPLTRTADVGGTLGCKAFAEGVAARIA